jgi:hypothetical protein
MKISRAFNWAGGMRVIAMVVATACLGAAVFLWLKQVKVEDAYAYTCDYPAFERVTADCLETVQVPVNRKFRTVGAEAEVVGRWTVHPVGTGEMVHPSQLSTDEPDRFRFLASGNPLPEELWGYYVPVAGDVLQAVKPGHLLTLVMVDPLSDQSIVVLDKAHILETNEGGVYVGAGMTQIAALEGLKVELTDEESTDAENAPWLVWTITQGANPDLPPLAVYSTELTSQALAQGATP